MNSIINDEDYVLVDCDKDENTKLKILSMLLTDGNYVMKTKHNKFIQQKKQINLC
jgi:hypothetical protein